MIVANVIRSVTAGPAKAAVIVALGLLTAGCDTLASLNPLDRPDRYEMEIVPQVPAQELYNDGLARVQRRDFAGAATAFSNLERQYPFSDWARRGLLMTAYAHFEGGSYDDAIGTAQRYLQLHPASEDAAYAQYLLAMSYYNQIPDVTRDQERTARALLAMQELIDRYPRSEYVEDARAKMLFAMDQLAGKEMEVGRFYLTRRNYTGAINRFREVVANYQRTRHVEEALMRLTEAYMALGIVPEAQTAAAVLGHNFPDSPWYRDAFVLLESGGLAPRENRESWISRAFAGIGRSIGISN